MTSTSATFSPSIDEIREAVTDEITTLGGSLSDLVSDRACLFMRVVLPATGEIRANDSVQAGVAVRAVPARIDVFPYTLREVCTNGAVIANAVQGQQFERIEAIDVGAPSYDGSVILAALREAVRECASHDAFEVAMRNTRAITVVDGAHGLQMLHMLARMHREDVHPYLPLIFGRFAMSEDQSAFGVMNAVTSIARDTVDPAVRWSLERMGGSLPAYLARRRRVTRAPAAPVEADVEALV